MICGRPISASSRHGPGSRDAQLIDRRPVVPAHRNPLKRRHRHSDGSRQARARLGAAHARLLRALLGATKLELIGEHFGARQVPELQPGAVRLEERGAVGGQRFQLRGLLLGRHRIEQREAQRRAHLPDRFAQLRFGERRLQRGLLPGAVALTGAPQQEVQRHAVEPRRTLGGGFDVFPEQLHGWIGALGGRALRRGDRGHLGALLGQLRIERERCREPLRAVPAERRGG